jgi:hypothetical protein
MNTGSWTTVQQALFRELVLGSPDPRANTSMLNRGDPGLLASLDRISAATASATSDGGASIAAHVDHLRYGMSLLNGRAAGKPLIAEEIDFTASWRRTAVTEVEWRELREALAREAEAWQVQLGTAQELTEVEARWFVGTVPHLAYHLGAIRQIDRATRGPTAEDEARVESELRRS